MNEVTNQAKKFFRTSEGKEVFRKLNEKIYTDVISAAQYYLGIPDGEFFNEENFDESVVRARNASVTLNTIMGGELSELTHFVEGKKQTPGLLTPFGVKKMISLYMHMFLFASQSSKKNHLETVRICRQDEVFTGMTTVGPLMSTTKLSIDEAMRLGYGNINRLAICRYKFHKGAVVFDMEELGKDYLKPHMREVLLLTGNRLRCRCCGYDNRYLGRDGQPALTYMIEVFPPHIINAPSSTKELDELQEIVYNEQTISEIQEFYKELNTSKEFPKVPIKYYKWKESFQKLVFHEINQLM